MDRETINRLNKINAEFYDQTALSFSRTREEPWPGWVQIVDLFCDHYEQTWEHAAGLWPFKVLDLACGNLRFESFLSTHYQNISWECLCIDNNPQLVSSRYTDAAQDEGAKNGNVCIHLENLDIVDALVKSLPLVASNSQFDLSVAFGFFHHIPGFELRLRCLKDLISATCPGGIIAVSFWRFMSNSKLAEKAINSTQAALTELPDLSLENNDYLLGWQQSRHTWRYCHHFDREEIDSLVQNVLPNAVPLAIFQSDGRDGKLNQYVVLQKRSAH